MTTGPFLLERITKQFWTDYEAWSRQFITPAHRRAVGIGMAVFGVFMAGFFAFDDERTKLEKAQGQIASFSPNNYQPYEPLDQSVFQSIESSFKDIKDTRAFIFFDSADRPAAVIAARLGTALKKANVQVMTTPGTVDADGEEGIQLRIHDHNNPTEADKKYIEAFKLSGIPFRVEENPDQDLNIFSFVVWIGPRKYKL